MLSFEILPWEGKTCFLVSYIDLSLKEHTVNETTIILRALRKHQEDCTKLFDTIDQAQAFMDTYLEHLKLYLAKQSPPKDGWVWARKETQIAVYGDKTHGS